MQHSSNYGKYEFANITSISGNTLNLSQGLANTYYSGTFNETTSSVTQVVRVPRYTNVTVNDGGSITASPWDGWSGGMVVFRATGTVNVSGDITVVGKGYRGGWGVDDNSGEHGYQGESWRGIGTRSTSSNRVHLCP